jgi:hypothetical protein
MKTIPISGNQGASFVGILIALVIVAFLVYMGSKIYFKSGSMDTATKQMLKNEGLDTSKSYIDQAKGLSNTLNQGIQKEQKALEESK